MTDEIKQAALKLARHIHERNYAGLILSGSTNHTSETILEAAWTNLYPTETLPPIYSFEENANGIFYKESLPDSERTEKAENLIAQEHPQLLDLKDKPVCYIDEFIHTGRKFEGIKQLFQSLGFEQFEFAFLASLEKKEYNQEIYIAGRSDELAGELVKLAIEQHGHPVAPEKIAELKENNKPLWQGEAEKKLSEWEENIKRK